MTNNILLSLSPSFSRMISTTETTHIIHDWTMAPSNNVFSLILKGHVYALFNVIEFFLHQMHHECMYIFRFKSDNKFLHFHSLHWMSKSWEFYLFHSKLLFIVVFFSKNDNVTNKVKWMIVSNSNTKCRSRMKLCCVWECHYSMRNQNDKD
jgi:hypothetical protein